MADEDKGLQALMCGSDDMSYMLEQRADNDGASSVSGSTGISPPGKVKPHRPCRVCGLIFSDMPARDVYCWDHKRIFEAVLRHFKWLDKKDSSKHAEELLALRDKHVKDPIPNPFTRKVEEAHEKILLSAGASSGLRRT